MNCIPKHLVNNFLEKLKSGEITPEKLLEMDSAQRHGYFAEFLGEKNAKWVNTLFEKKMLLKSQQEGILKWAKEVAGMKPEVKRDIISRVEKMENLLTPKEEDQFLADLVEHKLEATVTLQEASNIASLSKEVIEAKGKIAEDSPIGSQERMDYGRKMVEFQDYVNSLRDETKAKTLRQWVMPTSWGEAFINIAGLAKSMKASFDVSVIGRQGIKTLFTHPDIWLKNSQRAFGDFYNSMTGKDAMKEVRADVLSRPNALNGLYKKEGLAVGVQEEAFPSSAPENIPIIGDVFKGSQDSFTAWQYRTRADVFDRLVEVAEKTDADITGLGRMVNSLTGRGDIGVLEPSAKVLNNVFFSPRFLKSNIDILTAHALDKNMSPFVRKEAAINTIKVIFGVASVLAIAKAINPDSVELDARSADFGKIKIGNTRFDVSGGMSSIVTLASRIAFQSSKSSVTGLVTPLNSGKFGAKTGWDVVSTFFENKLSPAASVFRDYLKGQDFQGKKPTIKGEMANLFVPLPITNYMELKNDPESAPILLALMADALGIGTNTYGTNTDWMTKTGLEIEQFHEKVGDKEFKEANEKFNEQYREWFERAKKDERYQELTDDKKGYIQQRKREEIKDDIFKEYGFEYKPSKKKLPNIK